MLVAAKPAIAKRTPQVILDQRLNDFKVPPAVLIFQKIPTLPRGEVVVVQALFPENVFGDEVDQESAAAEFKGDCAGANQSFRLWNTAALLGRCDATRITSK